MEHLNGPQETNDHGSDNQSGPRQNQRRRSPEIPTVDACLIGLGALLKLIALGLLGPAEANSMRAIYQAILQHHQQSAAPGRRGSDKADLREALKTHPELANHFVGILSDEEIDEILAADEEPTREA